MYFKKLLSEHKHMKDYFSQHKETVIYSIKGFNLAKYNCRKNAFYFSV